MTATPTWEDDPAVGGGVREQSRDAFRDQRGDKTAAFREKVKMDS